MQDIWRGGGAIVSVRGLVIHTCQYFRLLTGTQFYTRSVGLGSYVIGTYGVTSSNQYSLSVKYDQLKGKWWFMSEEIGRWKDEVWDLWYKMRWRTASCSTHTHRTLRAISSEFLNRLAKLTSRKPSINSEVVYKIYPDHPNALCKVGLAPPNFPTMKYLWRKQDEKVETKKERDFSKKKNRNF